MRIKINTPVGYVYYDAYRDSRDGLFKSHTYVAGGVLKAKNRKELQALCEQDYADYKRLGVKAYCLEKFGIKIMEFSTPTYQAEFCRVDYLNQKVKK